MRVVVDTNVMVSAILSPHAPPAQVLRLVLQGELVPLYDHRMLSEYREVLSRPVFGFNAQDVAALIAGVQWTGEMVFATPLAIELPDADDLPFLEVASSGGADAIVTGNARHYRSVRGRHAVRIVTPRELIESLS